MREYKAITKTPMIPTRSNGMGKLMVEIIDIHLLSNNIILRDWIIIHDENGKEVLKKVVGNFDYDPIKVCSTPSVYTVKFN